MKRIVLATVIVLAVFMPACKKCYRCVCQVVRTVEGDPCSDNFATNLQAEDSTCQCHKADYM